MVAKRFFVLFLIVAVFINAAEDSLQKRRNRKKEEFETLLQGWVEGQEYLFKQRKTEKKLPGVLTVQDYRELSDESKQWYRKQFEEKILNAPKVHPMFEKPSYLGQVLNKGTYLSKCYKNSMIVSLGQSTAYYVKAAQILSEIDGNPNNNEYKYCAFSGRFLKHSKNAPNIFTRPFPNVGPNEEQLTKYKEYLSFLTLDPLSIVNRFDKEQKKTVFVEYVQHSEGLASFIYVLYRIGRQQGITQEALTNALEYCVYQQSFCRLNNVSIPSDVGILDESISVGLQRLAIENEPMVGLANADEFDDRLVPNFKFEEWERFDPLDFEFSDNAKLIIFKMIDHLHSVKKP